VTAFCSVLYVEHTAGTRRHGPSEKHSANVVLVADSSNSGSPRRGGLMLQERGMLKPLVCDAARCGIAVGNGGDHRDSKGAALEIVPLERGALALGAHGRFLRADPAGGVTLSPERCSTWEVFIAPEGWCTDAATISTSR
jgi:hypothetical protein